MSSTVKKSKPVKKAILGNKEKPMTKEEMVKKMFADQKIIREAIQNGVSFQELREKYGYKFKTL